MLLEKRAYELLQTYELVAEDETIGFEYERLVEAYHTNFGLEQAAGQFMAKLPIFEKETRVFLTQLIDNVLLQTISYVVDKDAEVKTLLELKSQLQGMRLPVDFQRLAQAIGIIEGRLVDKMTEQAGTGSLTAFSTMLLGQLADSVDVVEDADVYDQITTLIGQLEMPNITREDVVAVLLQLQTLQQVS
jgi:hypothetical protein